MLTVIGVDEAGRGSIVGPVVAAAVVLPKHIDGVDDSKTLGETRRRRLFQKILESEGSCWAVVSIDETKIDEVNTLQATMLAMRVAVSVVVSGGHEQEEGCTVILAGGRGPVEGPCLALIDGNRVPSGLCCSGKTVVGGDSRECSIASASILAKVTRDHLMLDYDKLHPEYKFAAHKGYHTKAHIEALLKYGASPIHRKTFAPLKTMTEGGSRCTCTKCMRKHRDNTVCNDCGQDFCRRCSTWWDRGLECCYGCSEKEAT